ncbi:hypothetical protein [Kingella potus]|uniref:hypothetical protein n=1 Tax=Kingella potus TaxID=265175 RepID=UPI001FCFA86D|nr:hypothetical protein [Kingella potus]UOP00877.1 hypothetical protein LVJ84_00070 [Kingella potus]
MNPPRTYSLPCARAGEGIKFPQQACILSTSNLPSAGVREQRPSENPQTGFQTAF